MVAVTKAYSTRDTLQKNNNKEIEKKVLKK